MKTMAQKAGLEPNVESHFGRKTMTQNLVNNGVSPTDIMQLSGHKNVQSILSYSTVSQKKAAEHYLHARRTELGRNSSPVCSCTPKKREQEFDELTYTTCRTQQSMQASSTAAPFSFLGAIIRVVHISAAINTLKSIAHSFSARGKPQQSSQNNQTY